jgi:acylphosphatase
MPSCRFIVQGLVQGVGYRYFAAREARSLGIDGYTRNLPDGTVEVVARADKEALRGFERLLREGPPAAIVDSVESTLINVAVPDGFSIH